ncbi:RagB/SusD family nutrient uptake outer membrane protein [Parabacteroides sp. FAFU027]|uniref:RagB/SusD family nutrient uptake outer membrane protein n=1 Tax=Parabacteroides sp. FAFU027 TaxID=2922715 RepID=UPI001FAFBFE7|nr:RagB/SusD family nutrient uptake outer membrane protein [Parabacteroides sp. FAFU027]
MKKDNIKNLYLLMLLGMTFLTGCNFTDSDMLAFKTEDDVTHNINSITTVINNVYSYLPDGYDRIGNAMLASACDEAEDVNDGEDIQNFNIGNWGSFSNPEGSPWSNSYNGIRKANAFLDLLKQVDWSYLKIGTPEEYNRRATLTTMHKYEAHFLRAFFYFELIKRYGGVPLVTRAYDPISELDSLKRIPRASFSRCVNYIVQQCDTAAKYLSADYYSNTATQAYLGRATKGAALALKARTLLYAASDLYNQPNNTDSLVGYTDANRQARWIRAAQACKAVLDMVNSSIYSFHSDYSALFLLRDAFSREVIFEKRYTASNTFDVLNYPVGFATGKSETCPTQNLVDAYEMKFSSSTDARSGKTIDDPTSGYDPANPYANRDPRLKKTIVYNGTTFGKNATAVQLWEGGSQGLPRVGASKTGYYLRKYVDETLDLTLNNTSKKQWVYFRLSEIYLDYAEAMLEAFGSPTATSAADGLTITALSAVNSVRTRAAVGMPALASTITAADFRARLRNERRVELAFEEHRYWDVRRWMTADQGIGGDIYGMRIQETTPGVYSYTRQKIETRAWSSKMYLYPIPQSEMNKSLVLVQNPGWK